MLAYWPSRSLGDKELAPPAGIDYLKSLYKFVQNMQQEMDTDIPKCQFMMQFFDSVEMLATGAINDLILRAPYVQEEDYRNQKIQVDARDSRDGEWRAFTAKHSEQGTLGNVYLHRTSGTVRIERNYGK